MALRQLVDSREEWRGMAWFAGVPAIAAAAAYATGKPILKTLMARPWLTLGATFAHVGVTHLLSQGGSLPRGFRPDLRGKTAIVTGGNSGIGYRVAATLAGWGAHVVIGCRNAEAGDAAAQQIMREIARTGEIRDPHQVRSLTLDLASRESVVSFVNEWKKLGHANLDILCNNAGIMFPAFGKTKEGFELQFGTNHMGHYLLTTLLTTYVEAAHGRVVNVSSAGHAWAGRPIDYDYVAAPTAEGYDRRVGYGWSKLANILHARALNTDLNGATAYSVHPGVVSTNLASSFLGSFGIALMGILTFPFLKRPQSGADAVLFCCVHPNATPGGYHKDCRTSLPTLPPGEDDIEAMAQVLWDRSLQMWSTAPTPEESGPECKAQ